MENYIYFCHYYWYKVPKIGRPSFLSLALKGRKKMYAVCYNCKNYFRIRNRKKRKRRCPSCRKYSSKNHSDLIYLTNKEFFNWIRERILQEDEFRKKLEWLYISLNEGEFNGALPKDYKIKVLKKFIPSHRNSIAYVDLIPQIIRIKENNVEIYGWEKTIDTMIHEMIHIKRWKYRHLLKWICCISDPHCKHFKQELEKYNLEMDPKLANDIESTDIIKGIPPKPTMPEGSPRCWGTYDGLTHCKKKCPKVHGKLIWESCIQENQYKRYLEQYGLLPDEASQ